MGFLKLDSPFGIVWLEGDFHIGRDKNDAELRLRMEVFIRLCFKM